MGFGELPHSACAFFVVRPLHREPILKAWYLCLPPGIAARQSGNCALLARNPYEHNAGNIHVACRDRLRGNRQWWLREFLHLRPYKVWRARSDGRDQEECLDPQHNGKNRQDADGDGI